MKSLNPQNPFQHCSRNIDQAMIGGSRAINAAGPDSDWDYIVLTSNISALASDLFTCGFKIQFDKTANYRKWDGNTCHVPHTTYLYEEGSTKVQFIVFTDPDSYEAWKNATLAMMRDPKLYMTRDARVKLYNSYRQKVKPIDDLILDLTPTQSTSLNE